MVNRRNFFALALAAALLPAVASAQQPPLTAKHLNQLGPENSLLAERAGVWDVVETIAGAPGAAPGAGTTTNKLVAERKMVGPFLQEIIRPALGSAQVLRTDYLNFNRVEGRWKYVSMDTRVPVGIMSAASYGTGDKSRIDVTFEPFSSPDTGQLMQMNQVFVLQDANHDRKDQRFVVADGKGTTSSHHYVYTRRQAVAVAK